MKATISRLENALKGLTAIESETVNLVTILRVDITQLAKARIAAEIVANGYRRPLVVQEIAKSIVVAEDAEERAEGLANELLNGGRLAKNGHYCLRRAVATRQLWQGPIHSQR